MSFILVVDDSRFTRRMLRQALEELGHTVDEAANGAEAIEKYTSARHDLVTLDLLMPGVGGLATLTQLRELNPAVKTIVATADIQTSTRAQVQVGGASAMINKPLNREELHRTVTAVLTGDLTQC